MALIQRVNHRQSITELIDLFQRYNQTKGLSEFTTTFYDNTLKQFKNFLDRNGITEILKRTYEDYVLYLKSEYSNSVTINSYLRGVRAFLYFLMEEGEINHFKINLIKQEKKTKQTYSEEDIKKLIKKPNLKQCDFGEYRSWVAVNFLIDTGLRLNSVLNIKIIDVDLKLQLLTVRHSKNKQQFVIPISAPLGKILTNYIREWGLTDDDFLFPDITHKQMTRSCFQKAIYRFCDDRNVRGKGIHCFRHTFAKNWILNGGDALRLQKILCHSDLSMTKDYLALFATDLQKDYEKFTMLSKLNPDRVKRIK